MTPARQSIDWEQVQNRLAAAQQAMERALTPDAAQIAATYRRRADDLARRGVQAAVHPTVPMLVVGLGGERYALPLAELGEVVPFADCARIPGASSEVLGAINVRGEIRVVVDLAALLGLPRDAEAPAGLVLLLRRREVGLRVDRADRVQAIDPELLVGTGGAATGPSSCVVGSAGDQVMVLSVPALLGHPALGAT